jgi:hypothetical protein
MKTTNQNISIIRTLLSSERGFAMIPAITAVFVGSLISLGAWTAAHSDISLQNSDHYSKVAYSQAESGVSDYVQHMGEDSGYWQYCDDPEDSSGNPLGVGQIALNDTDKTGTSGTLARRWLPQPTFNSAQDAALTAQYTIDLIPANGQPSCDAKPVRSESMVDKSTGTIRIRVTGRAGPPAPSTASIAAWRAKKWRKRSIVIEFRRKGFLDYAYFTDKEGIDPAIQNAPMNTICAAYYSPKAGELNTASRFYYNGNQISSGTYRSDCGEITFAAGDVINGPFHTNDSVSTNLGATFGRAGKNDATEVYDQACPFRTDTKSIPNGVTDSAAGNEGSNKCTGTPGSVKPNLNGPLRIGNAAGFLPLPESNQDLLLYADDSSTDPDYHGYTYYGKTTVTLKTGGVMDVVNNGVTQTNIPYPPSGVLYVADSVGASSCLYDPGNNYPSIGTGCALLEVKGTYDDSLTLTSDSDIVITGDVRRAATADTAVLGLIANMFLRIRHYAAAGYCGNATNTSGNPKVNYLDAAILTLHHSFTVDWHGTADGPCNTGTLGTLNETGVLAQAYRGVVNSGTGYTKNYVYDDRFKYLTPPHFLVPALSSWRVARYREQVPACTCT